MKIFLWLVLTAVAVSASAETTSALPPSWKYEPCVTYNIQMQLQRERLERFKRGEKLDLGWSKEKADQTLQDAETRYEKECKQNEKH